MVLWNMPDTVKSSTSEKLIAFLQFPQQPGPYSAICCGSLLKGVCPWANSCCNVTSAQSKGCPDPEVQAQSTATTSSVKATVKRNLILNVLFE